MRYKIRRKNDTLGQVLSGMLVAFVVIVILALCITICATMFYFS